MDRQTNTVKETAIHSLTLQGGAKWHKIGYTYENTYQNTYRNAQWSTANIHMKTYQRFTYENLDIRLTTI